MTTNMAVMARTEPLRMDARMIAIMKPGVLCGGMVILIWWDVAW